MYGIVNLNSAFKKCNFVLKKNIKICMLKEKCSDR